MKALKNESTTYTQQITAAISECYAKNTEPTNAQLMELYNFIGQLICEQGEKAFVVHLADTLATELPQIKGFSPRNLRRMRDFYRTYENSQDLMQKAKALNWTNNIVIMDCCETDEQREFYIALAIENNLSKLALIKAIKDDIIITQTVKCNGKAVQAVTAPVSKSNHDEAVDTTATTKTACGTFVTACEPSRQGSGLHNNNKLKFGIAICKVFGNRFNDRNRKPLNRLWRWQPWFYYKTQEHLRRLKYLGCLQRLPRLCCQSSESPPAQWWHDFKAHLQAIGFA